MFKAFGKSKIFVERPVDPVESGCPDYFQWIRPEEARDLGTIRAQLKSRTHFPTPRAFADVRSLFTRFLLATQGSTSLQEPRPARGSEPTLA